MFSVTGIREAVNWRIPIYRQRFARAIGTRDIQWGRVIMDRETDRLLREVDFRNMDAIEISGTKWESFGFRNYKSLQYPEFDICTPPTSSLACDVLIAEQVFEHILWPYRAVKNVHSLLRSGGKFLITTPFLVRIHNHPVDCSRWTEVGIKYLLAEGGFPLEGISTGSWGNRRCIRSNYQQWTKYVPWLHSLKNEPDFPVVVWALAEKS